MLENEKLKQTIIDQHVEDLAGKRALAEPIPGALKDAFSLAPDITVGPYKVRRFRDGDFRLLLELKNPLYDYLRACLNGKPDGDGIKIEPSGQTMYEIAYLFTRPAIYSRDIIVGGGVEKLKSEAEEEFGELRLAALSQLLEAVINQAVIYATANISYGQEKQKGQEGESGPNPPS